MPYYSDLDGLGEPARYLRTRVRSRRLGADGTFLARIRGRLHSVMKSRGLRRPGFGTEVTLTVIVNGCGDIVATAFEQDLRIAGDDPRACMLLPRPEHSAVDITVPASFRHLPWPELHARLRLHPGLSVTRPARGQKAKARPPVSSQSRYAWAEQRAEPQGDLLEPIEIRRPLV